jgi:hypothetical protein
MEWPFKHSLGRVSSVLRNKYLIVKNKNSVNVGQAYHSHGKQAYNPTRMRF